MNALTTIGPPATMAPLTADAIARLSLMERIALLPPKERRWVLRGYGPEKLALLITSWCICERRGQMEPDGDWRIWLMMAGRGYVLGDHSVGGTGPEGWARRVAEAFEIHEADRIVVENNMGGDMVESVLRSVEAALPVKPVRATRGKSARAEPVAALFESGRAKFAGAFPELEDELSGLTIGGDYEGPGNSPDRADAMVWALTELMLGKEPRVPRIIQL